MSRSEIIERNERILAAGENKMKESKIRTQAVVAAGAGAGLLLLLFPPPLFAK